MTRCTDLIDSVEEKRLELDDRYALLLHRISFSDCDSTLIGGSVFANRIEVHGDAERSPRFVLSPITSTNRTGLVVKNHHMRTQNLDDFTSLTNQLFIVLQQRKNTAFDRGHAWMEFKDNSGFEFAFLIRYHFLAIRCANQREHGPIHTGTGFDHVGHETLLGFFVEILKRFAARLLMLRQIVVRPVGDTLQFLNPKRKIKFDIISAFRIMSAFFRRNFMNMQKLREDPNVFIKFESLF